jgi:hypothetical protein
MVSSGFILNKLTHLDHLAKEDICFSFVLRYGIPKKQRYVSLAIRWIRW